MKDIKRQLTFKTCGREYSLSFPTVRQFFQIESMRAELSRGQYHKMVMANNLGSAKALDYIDMVSILTILSPVTNDSKKSTIINDLRVDDLSDLSIDDAVQLLTDFNDQVLPWYNQWMKLFMKPDEDKNDKKGSKS